MEFQKSFTDIEQMSFEDLKSELQMMRNLWTWIPEDIKFLLLRIGTEAAVTLRNYKRYVGNFGQPHWKLDGVELEVTATEFDYNVGSPFLEQKIVEFSMGNVVLIEYMDSREQQESSTAAASDEATKAELVGLIDSYVKEN